MDRITGPKIALEGYAAEAYAAIAPDGSTTARCCDPVEHEDGTWSIGCEICLASSVPLPDGVERVGPLPQP